MIHGKRVLWAMNVYGGIQHLHQQQEIVRHVLGDQVTILVFCNNTDPNVNPKYKEDRLSRVLVNSGHHNGVRDAHNDVLGHLPEFDLVISSHADSFMQDYSVVPEIIGKMVDGGYLLAQLQCIDGENPHHRKVLPQVYNDFFVADARMWERAGRIEDNCDGDGGYGIETTLGVHFRRVVSPEQIMVIPGVLHDQRHPHCFGDFWRKGDLMLRENFVPAKNDWIKNYCPEYRDVLDRAGLLI